jgi:hypothetical protein
MHVIRLLTCLLQLQSVCVAMLRHVHRSVCACACSLLVAASTKFVAAQSSLSASALVVQLGSIVLYKSSEHCAVFVDDNLDDGVTVCVLTVYIHYDNFIVSYRLTY